MTSRLVFVAVVLSLLCSSVAIVTYQPMVHQLATVVRTHEPDSAVVGQVARLIPLLFFGDALVLALLIWLALVVFVGLPVARTEEAIRHIAGARPDSSLSLAGPLAGNLGHALAQLKAALEQERERNRGQVEQLTRTNERLARLQAELVAADRMATVGKLAAGVAHEVGNPLAGILGYVSVLRLKAGRAVPEEGPRADLGQVLDRVEQEVQRIDAIVRSLLELGRPSRGKAQPVDVRPTIDSVLRLLGKGELGQVDVTVDAPDSLWLRAEQGPLSQVLINLLLNAAQAMGPGRVTVRAGVAEGRGFISVLDEGPGLKGEVEARLFEPFFTTKPAGEGTGLGLAISRHLLLQFEGALRGGNRTDGRTGACFTIELPVP